LYLIGILLSILQYAKMILCAILILASAGARGRDIIMVQDAQYLEATVWAANVAYLVTGM
jgi:hypothetical protein